MADELKEAMTTRQSVEITPEMKMRIKAVKDQFNDIIPGLAKKYDNSIPFSALKEETNRPYQLISDVVLALIMEKRITGFINDGGTEALDDDVLIIRESRFMDTLVKDYKTGYAE